MPGGRDFEGDWPKDWRWIHRAVTKETEELRWDRPWHPRPLDVVEGPPFTDLPFSPFMENRAQLISPGAAFWVQLTDWALLPHLLRYESVPHLLQILSDLSLDDLLEISRRMAGHYAKLLVASTNFWRAVVMSMVEDHDASKWKG